MSGDTWEVSHGRSTHADEVFKRAREIAGRIDQVVREFIDTVWPQEGPRLEAAMAASSGDDLLEEFVTASGWVRVSAQPSRIEWQFQTRGLGGNYLSVFSSGQWAFFDFTDGATGRGTELDLYFSSSGGDSFLTGVNRVRDPEVFVTGTRELLGDYLRYRGYIS